MATIEIDPLEYVRARLATTGQQEWTRYAAAAGVSLRTVQNIKNGHSPQYQTVKALHDVMRAEDVKPKKKR